MRFLRISNAELEIDSGQPGYDRLGKVRVLINILKMSVPGEYHLPRDIAVDESMIPFKGHLIQTGLPWVNKLSIYLCICVSVKLTV